MGQKERVVIDYFKEVFLTTLEESEDLDVDFPEEQDMISIDESIVPNELHANNELQVPAPYENLIDSLQHPPLSTELTPQSNKSPLCNISMYVLSGFAVALGIAAIAVAFTVLNAATMGGFGIGLAVVGALAVGAGIYGFFAAGKGCNNEIPLVHEHEHGMNSL